MDWLSRFRKESGVGDLTPLCDITNSVIFASTQCENELEFCITNNPFNKYNKFTEQKFEIFSEFLFFFLHRTSRVAYRRLPRGKANHLLNTIGQFAASSVVNSALCHEPDARKAGLRRYLYDNLNQAEKEYATCVKLREATLPPGRSRTRLDDGAALSRLALRVLSKIRQEKIDPTQLDAETAVLAEAVEAVVNAKLVAGNAPCPGISTGTLKELGLRVERASAALTAYKRDAASSNRSSRQTPDGSSLVA